MLGHGDTANQRVPKEVAALRGTPVAAVAAASSHSLAVTVAGAVFSWGLGTWHDWGSNTDRDNGLGHGDGAHQLLPRRVEALAGIEAVHVSAGSHFSVVVDAAGTAHAFGANWGKLGLGDADDRALPTAIDGLSLV